MKLYLVLIIYSILSVISAQDDRCWYPNLAGENGTITSPNYPDNYPNDAFCDWKITVEANKTIEIKFNFFQLEYDSNCDYDSLVIYEESIAQIMHKLCGSDIVPPISSPANVLKLRFTSDASLTYQGFELLWRSIPNQ